MGNGITSSILLMLVIMLTINIGLTFTQTAVKDLGSDLTVLNSSSSPLSNYHTGTLQDGTSLINESYIPGDDVTADTDEGNIFTDIYVALRTWTTTGLSSLKFVANILVQPAGFLRTVGVNSGICLAIQILWSMVFVFLLTAWIMGRT